MPPLFWLTPRAHLDLNEIWNFIARDIVVYRPDAKPIQIVAIVHGKRNIKRALEPVDEP